GALPAEGEIVPAQLPGGAATVRADPPSLQMGAARVRLARRPFHRSPGRWYFLCPACGRHCLRLIDWRCTRSAGAPASLSWRLSRHQRLERALKKAALTNRKHGESAAAYERRRRRARAAEAKAVEVLDREVRRLAALF